MFARTSTLTLALLLCATPAFAYEGKWTPDQVLQLGDAHLKKLGLRVPAKRLWDPKRGTGLLAGAVKVNGCSGAFVSPEGLLVTNHHCLFSVVQQHSTPERNLIDEGFLARSRAEELPGKTERVRIPRKFTDVTAAILAAIPEGADDLQRTKAIERKSKELVATCEQRPATRCQVASFDGGVAYTLVDTLELADVRLVYAPPRAVGEYGGEIDNWMWPRHGGDFAIARAYVAKDGTAATFDPANVPFRPEFFFPIQKKGVKPDDFVMVLGYPGVTYRSLTTAEVAERKELFFAARKTMYGEWIEAMEEAAKKDPAGAILVADDLKSLENRRKNARGQLAGFERGKLLEKRRAHEEAVAAWAKARPKFQAALAARDELQKVVQEGRRGFDRDFLLDHLRPEAKIAVSKLLYLPTTLARVSQERIKPDLDRDPAFMDRELKQLGAALELEQKRLFQPSDRAVTLAIIRRALALPRGQRIAAIDQAFGKLKPAELPAAVDGLYSQSKVFDPAERKKMFEESEAQLRARKDPLLDLGFALSADVAARVERQNRHKGAVTRLRVPWRKAVVAHAGKPVDPDANGTLRVSFATVKGYSPRDGVFHLPQTTLQGLLAKDEGKPPFDVPKEIRQAAEAGRYGAWRDPVVRDVPIDFLSDADTTGGNSGSPTVNARGELVGVNFDRVWENVANDFGYNPDIARNVNADIRYMLWLLDQVVDADTLLRELGIRKGPGAPPAR